MKNSVILSFLAVAYNRLVSVYKKSITFKALNGIYLAFSNAWNSSVIIGFINRDAAETERGLMFSGLRRFFTFTPRPLKALFAESEIRKGIYAFADALLAVNTRVLSVLLNSFALSYAAMFIILGNNRFMPVFIGILAAGVILGIYNVNLYDKFKVSKTAAVISKLFDIKFNDGLGFAAEGHSVITAAIFGIAGGALFCHSFLYAVIFICAMCGFCVVMAKPLAGVFIAAAAAPLVPTMALAGIVGLTYLSFLFNRVTARENHFRLDGVGLLIALFLAINAISAAASYARGDSVRVFLMSALFIGFYFIIVNTINTKTQVFSLIKLMVVMGVIVSLYGIVQYVFGWNTANAWIDEKMFEEATMRAYSTL